MFARSLRNPFGTSRESFQLIIFPKRSSARPLLWAAGDA